MTTIMNEKEELFNKVMYLIHSRVDDNFWNNMSTFKSNTQTGEKYYIDFIKHVLDENGFGYTCAGSQQPVDLRNVYEKQNPDIKINVELKKTNSDKIKLNNTLPCNDVYYILFAVKYKYIIFKNGDEFIKDFHEEIDAFKKMFMDFRAYAKNIDMGNISVYPIANYDLKITDYISDKTKAEKLAAKEAKKAEKLAAKEAKKAEKLAAKEAKKAEKLAQKLQKIDIKVFKYLQHKQLKVIH